MTFPKCAMERDILMFKDKPYMQFFTLSSDTNLFDQDGQALVFERFGEVDVSGPLGVYGQWSHYHVHVFTDQLRNDAIPFLLSGLIDLYCKKYTITVYLLLIYGYSMLEKCKSKYKYINMIIVHKEHTVCIQQNLFVFIQFSSITVTKILSNIYHKFL